MKRNSQPPAAATTQPSNELRLSVITRDLRFAPVGSLRGLTIPRGALCMVDESSLSIIHGDVQWAIRKHDYIPVLLDGMKDVSPKRNRRPEPPANN